MNPAWQLGISRFQKVVALSWVLVFFFEMARLGAYLFAEGLNPDWPLVVFFPGLTLGLLEETLLILATVLSVRALSLQTLEVTLPAPLTRWGWPVALGTAVLAGWFSTQWASVPAVVILMNPALWRAATSLPLSRAIKRAWELGLDPNAGLLKKAGRVGTVVFEKSGILTVNQPVITDVIALEGQNADEIHTLAASLENDLPQPLAGAVVSSAYAKGLRPRETNRREMMEGLGVKGLIDGKYVLVGSRPLFESKGIRTIQAASLQTALETAGKSVFFVGRGESLAGLIAYTDALRSDAGSALAILKKNGFTLVLLTGDHQRAAAELARNLGIHKVVGELKPEDKIATLEGLVKDGHHIARFTRKPAELIDLHLDFNLVMNGRYTLTDLAAALILARRTYRTARINLIGTFIFQALSVTLTVAENLTPVTASFLALGWAALLFLHSRWATRSALYREFPHGSSNP